MTGASFVLLTVGRWGARSTGNVWCDDACCHIMHANSAHTCFDICAFHILSNSFHALEAFFSPNLAHHWLRPGVLVPTCCSTIGHCRVHRASPGYIECMIRCETFDGNITKLFISRFQDHPNYTCAIYSSSKSCRRESMNEGSSGFTLEANQQQLL